MEQRTMGPLPRQIEEALRGFSLLRDGIGRSEAGVYRCQKGEEVCYLKIEALSEESMRERQMLRWLQGRLPVPRILAEAEREGRQYLLLSALAGEMACAEDSMRMPLQTARLLARGIRMFRQVDISHCPSVRMLEQKLHSARFRVQSGAVRLASDWHHETLHTPLQILEHLERHRPAEETLVFSHGDYCLPNVFFSGGEVSGFLDLGRAGVADIWQDIALCVRSMEYNLGRGQEQGEAFSRPMEAFFEELGMAPDFEKIDYYILLDELF